ncbi:hypothetical protein HN873_048297 [Arachis hypogaea]
MESRSMADNAKSVETNDMVETNNATLVMHVANTSNTKLLNIPLAENLHESHFVTLSICGQELQDQLDKQEIPQRFATPEDNENIQKETKKYQQRRVDDYNVTSWLFASIHAFFEHRVIRCHFALEVWSRIYTYLMVTLLRPKNKRRRRRRSGRRQRRGKGKI